MRIALSVRIFLAALALALVGVLIPSDAPAASERSGAPAKVSYCSPWNIDCQTHLRSNNGSWIALRYSPAVSRYNIYGYVPNKTRFAMRCWTWGENSLGNYWSAKWFYGQNWYNGAFTYVHSSYVYNQISVGRC